MKYDSATDFITLGKSHTSLYLYLLIHSMECVIIKSRSEEGSDDLIIKYWWSPQSGRLSYSCILLIMTVTLVRLIRYYMSTLMNFMPAFLGIMNLQRYNFLLVLWKFRIIFYNATELIQVASSNTFWLRFIMKAWKYCKCTCRNKTIKHIKNTIYISIYIYIMLPSICVQF